MAGGRPCENSLFYNRVEALDLILEKMKADNFPFDKATARGFASAQLIDFTISDCTDPFIMKLWAQLYAGCKAQILPTDMYMCYEYLIYYIYITWIDLI